jgi:serine protease inhibitor
MNPDLALELPYVGHDVSLVLLPPHKAEGLASLEDQITVASLAEWPGGLKPERVALSLSRFAMSAELDLKQTLTGLCSSRIPFDLTEVTQQVSICANRHPQPHVRNPLEFRHFGKVVGLGVHRWPEQP